MDKRVIELIAEGNLPYTTPHTCECGAELLVNDNLTRMWCSDTFCPIHNSQKLIKMLEILDIKAGIGDTVSQDLVDYLGIKKPIDLFNPIFEGKKDYRFSRPSAINSLFRQIDEIREDGIEFYKMINIMFLPLLGRTRSKTLFSEFSTPEEFYEKYPDKDSMKVYVGDKLNIAYYTDTVVTIVDDMINYKEDILNYAKWFKFKKSWGEVMFITITGDILFTKDDEGKLFKPRSKYAEYLSNKYNLNIQEVGFSQERTNYLIMDNDMRSNNKYKRATAAGIPVLRSDEYEQVIRKELGLADEEAEEVNMENQAGNLVQKLDADIMSDLGWK